MNETLTNFPRIHRSEYPNGDYDWVNPREAVRWKKGFERRIREIHQHPLKWLADNKEAILKRFGYPSSASFDSRLLRDILVYFIETEVLGEKSE